jgi:hypothetical protein
VLCPLCCLFLVLALFPALYVTLYIKKKYTELSYCRCFSRFSLFCFLPLRAACLRRVPTLPCETSAKHQSSTRFASFLSSLCCTSLYVSHLFVQFLYLTGTQFSLNSCVCVSVYKKTKEAQP